MEFWKRIEPEIRRGRHRNPDDETIAELEKSLSTEKPRGRHCKESNVSSPDDTTASGSGGGSDRQQGPKRKH